MSVIRPLTSEVVKAHSWEGWTVGFALFNKPKMTIRCGGCYWLFKTRDYIPLTDRSGSAAMCTSCKKWNLFPLVYG